MNRAEALKLLDDKKAWNEAVQAREIPDLKIGKDERSFSNLQNLDGYHFPDGFDISNCELVKNTKLTNCVFHGSIVFPSNTGLNGTDLSNSIFYGPVRVFKTIGCTWNHSRFYKDIDFSESPSNGSESFLRTRFYRDVTFRARHFQKVTFRGAEFHGNADFTNSFFDQRANFSQTKFLTRPPILGGSTFKTEGAFIGMKLHVRPALKNVSDREQRIELAEDISDDLQLLKIRAESTHTHDLAVDCHALWLLCQEVTTGHRLRRWISRVYWALSDYGRSALRPLLWSILVTVCSFILYQRILSGKWTGIIEVDTMHYAISRLVPVPGIYSTGTRSQLVQRIGVDSLGVGEQLAWALLSSAHGILGLLTIFLIGLALRNRFRIG